MRPQHKQDYSTDREGGFALVVALLLLVAMSFIGIASLKNVTLQERMAGNTYFKLASFQEADGAMRAAEQIMHGIFGGNTAPAPGQPTNNVWKSRDDNGSGAAYWGTSGAWTLSQSVTPLGYSDITLGITTEDVSGSSVMPFACSGAGITGIGGGADEAALPCKVRPVRETSTSSDSVTGARSVIQQYFYYRSDE